MEGVITILIAGFFGGALRGIVGYVKYQTSFKNVPFKPLYFFGMTALSGAIGVIAAFIAKDLRISFIEMRGITPSVAFILGYAGGDFIENIFKIITKKPTLFSLDFLNQNVTKK